MTYRVPYGTRTEKKVKSHKDTLLSTHSKPPFVKQKQIEEADTSAKREFDPYDEQISTTDTRVRHYFDPDDDRPYVSLNNNDAILEQRESIKTYMVGYDNLCPPHDWDCCFDYYFHRYRSVRLGFCQSSCVFRVVVTDMDIDALGRSPSWHSSFEDSKNLRPFRSMDFTFAQVTHGLRWRFFRIRWYATAMKLKLSFMQQIDHQTLDQWESIIESHRLRLQAPELSTPEDSSVDDDAGLLGKHVDKGSCWTPSVLDKLSKRVETYMIKKALDVWNSIDRTWLLDLLPAPLIRIVTDYIFLSNARPC